METYPNRMPRWALDEAVRLADQFGARLSGILCETHIPAVGNWLSDKFAHTNALVATENIRSLEAAQELLDEFSLLVSEDRRGEQFLVECGLIGNPTEPARLARTHDLAVVPVETNVEYQVAAEGLIFDSGRPVLLLPQPVSSGRRFDNVIIGWDGGRSAARALAEALPICRTARSIRVLAITGEKALDAALILKEVHRHLVCHDLASSMEQVPADGCDAGTALLKRGVETGADLLIMGAYGHSRTRESVLGGATRSVIHDPRLPVLLCH
ncbi:universal stress protein [Sphingobium subterraneum]|uniref:Nucleotide-binding universal stress UspA family protein n=1 Tax=Sphingobium subterraneum TaxID=627688 RepID=A0A841J2Q8_9SPHN|nr:universal stress protein [Sphingobium subterraneum]MBB6125469.1 nucleotide-binding universal stress UspA family protein [Sphingobium subterraneum]